MKLEKESRPWTAVRKVLDFFCTYMRLLHDLKIFISTYKWVVNMILSGRRGRDAPLYVDDTSIGTMTVKKNLKFLDEV